jgi:hypothetical protein
VLVPYEGLVVHVYKLAAAYVETPLHHMRVVLCLLASHRQML